MAGSINKVILVGNLGFDPEIRATQDGREICNLRLATSESWKDRTTGERKEKTEWHRVVIFSEPLVRVAKEYLKKRKLEATLMISRPSRQDILSKLTAAATFPTAQRTPARRNTSIYNLLWLLNLLALQFLSFLGSIHRNFYRF